MTGFGGSKPWNVEVRDAGHLSAASQPISSLALIKVPQDPQPRTETAPTDGQPHVAGSSHKRTTADVSGSSYVSLGGRECHCRAAETNSERTG